MAKVLGIIGNARKDGYTIRVLSRALEGAKSISGVDIELIHLLDYQFGPCISCYACIRSRKHRCIKLDDMGHKGKGKLWKKIEKANALILAAPVHHWSADALTHLFIERLYPFLWSGELRGIPVVTISVASNQGFQTIANEMLCEWAFTMGMQYIGGLPVHVSYLNEALQESKYLGTKLGEAALADEKEGRKAKTDEEMWLSYQDKPWSVFPHYINNLTMGTNDPQHSIIKKALLHGSFKKKEAVELLIKADQEFDKFSHYYSQKDHSNAILYLVRASAFWTHATWKEFLEEQLIHSKQPRTYRPIE